jgi:hypothetical protein
MEKKMDEKMDETRDPEFEWVRAHWDSPAPTPGFHERVLAAYEREFGYAPPWRRWLAFRVPLPVAAAAVFGAFILALFTAPYFRGPAPQSSSEFKTASEYRYKPVSQPRFIVISQGEHP